MCMHTILPCTREQHMTYSIMPQPAFTLAWLAANITFANNNFSLLMHCCYAGVTLLLHCGCRVDMLAVKSLPADDEVGQVEVHMVLNPHTHLSASRRAFPHQQQPQERLCCCRQLPLATPLPQHLTNYLAIPTLGVVRLVLGCPFAISRSDAYCSKHHSPG